MDGLKARLAASVQFRLSLGLAMSILLVAMVATVSSFRSAYDEAYELQDETLRQIASLLGKSNLRLITEPLTGEVNEDDPSSQVIVQSLNRHPSAAVRPGQPHLILPGTLRDGIYTLDSAGTPYRVLIRSLGNGERVAVAQATWLRDENARESAESTIMPFLVLIPLMLLITAILIRRTFVPITRAADELDRRDDVLSPLDEQHIPAEIKPFVRSINRLLARIAALLGQQRRFIADAAHELRSPLTALTLQVERLAGTELSEAARERLDQVKIGIERERLLLEKLLDLARAQTDAEPLAEPVSLHQLFRTVLADLLPLAESRQQDIGLQPGEDIVLTTSAFDLALLVRNLIENAIRYTPEGGRIDLVVSQQAQSVVIQIRDNGPGIAPDDRERVFDAFYRIPGSSEIGSGLGLSIVQSLARRLGATIRLAWTDEVARRGLAVWIVFDQ
ncbi:ATP-binding protein [Paludibacterium sp. B53371]|uniref:ATP-binding protein n=1 Tax=Paludibacterium sp. B53371 TaxID=2806263 RepID=UPI001C0448F2|nr:ATP-binding protein [Paludibacterium sp. B53371]